MHPIPDKARWHGVRQPAQSRSWRKRYFFDADNRLGKGHGKLFVNFHGWREIEYGPDGRATNDPYPIESIPPVRP